MIPSEAAEALAVAAAFDRRTVGTVEARAWAEAFPANYTRTEVARAIVAHYASSTEFLMPKHVITLVTAERATNRERYMAENFNAVPNADPDDVNAWLDALRRGDLVDTSPKPDSRLRRPVDALVAQTLNRRATASAQPENRESA